MKGVDYKFSIKALIFFIVLLLLLLVPGEQNS